MSHFRLPYVLVPLVLVALVVAGLAGDWWIGLPEQIQPRYVGRQSCLECHAEQVQQWTGSHHDLAMDLATPQTVLANFDNQTFTGDGVTSRMFRRDDKFFVETEGPSGTLETFQVKYTFGVDPLQQYLVELPGGRVQCLRVCWDTKEKRWFQQYPDEKIPLNDELHWTKRLQNWNYMCAECHSTNVEKNYDAKTNTYHTTFSEIDVSCEACHGPASVHVQLAKSYSPFWDRRHGYGLVKLKDKNPKAQLETCAMCHARRRIVHEDFLPGHEFLDHYEPELLDGNLYHSDGQIRDEVYEYGSFLQSLMYRKGVRCTDCHDPHTARLRAAGNQLCGRCHTAGKYDTPAHHHHPLGKGSLCVECHMPETRYMVVDPRRDHSIRVPRPDLTVLLGMPNACTGCHQEKTPQWAADQVIAWYGPKRRDDPHYALAIAAGRSRQLENRPAGPQESIAEDLQKTDREIGARLRVLARRTDVGPTVRASAIALLGGFPSAKTLEATKEALKDPEPLVRAAAVRTIDLLFGLRAYDVQRMATLPPAAALQMDETLRDYRTLLAPLLKDPVRLVRAEAARFLTVVPEDRLSAEELKSMSAALAEFRAGQLSMSDQPGAHLNLAVVLENQGRLAEAEASYRTALRLDPGFAMAQNNLAVLCAREGKTAEAEELLRKVTLQQPLFAQGHYQLGLLLAEDLKRMAEAAACFEKAVEQAPTHPRMHYNLGLALQHLDRKVDAEKSLLAAWRLSPESFEYLNALAVLYMQERQWSRAIPYVEEMLRLSPDQRELRQTLEQLRARAGSEP